MDPTQKAKRLLAVTSIGLILLFAGVWIFKRFFMPTIEEKAAENLLRETSSDKSYTDLQKIALDGFPGYAVLRSEEYRLAMGRSGTKVLFEDDKGDYDGRMNALKSGSIDLAAFTIDADLITGESLGDFPGVIVLVIDRSHGADGIVAFKSAVPSVTALNRPDAKIVATANSPWETLARHLIANMAGNLKGQPWLIKAEGSLDVLKHIESADKNLIQAFALGEPELSMALKIPGVHKLYDSSMTNGAIIDVLLANRTYLRENPQKVQQSIEAYLRALFTHREKMADLVLSDATAQSLTLTVEQANQIVAGIEWVNTQENYAYMGLLPREQSRGIETLDLVIARTARFLVKSGKLKTNSVEGSEHELYFKEPLAHLFAANFRPGDGEADQVRGEELFLPLSDEQWNQLSLIGDMNATMINFRAMQSDLGVQGKRDVSEIVEGLKNFAGVYITVIGNAAAGGDPQANLKLAHDRSQTVVDRMITLGLNKNRLRVQTNPQANHGTGQSVVFRLYQRGY